MEDKFFISYKSQDVAFVRKVAERLKAEGISVWIDEYGIRHNEQDIDDEIFNIIFKAIDNSNWAILFITEKFATSDNCIKEVKYLLRKLPLNRLIPVILEKSQKFKSEYPILYNQGYMTNYIENNIYDAMIHFGALRCPIQSHNPQISNSMTSWHVKEACFKIEFDKNIWTIYNAALFHGILERKKMDFNKSYKNEYHVFKGNINGIITNLLLDYDLYDGTFSKSILGRMKGFEDVRRKNYDEDDIARLKDELRNYNFEVKNVLAHLNENSYILPENYRSKLLNQNLISEIGVHRLSTNDRGVGFNHRLFSFKITNDNLIFRVYKLVLPHPQFQKTFRIRFIFCLNCDLKDFYRTVPWCDELVNSFNWTSPSLPQMGTDLFKNARKTFKRS